MNMILETYIEEKELYEEVSVALIEETMLMEAEFERLEEGMADDVKKKVRDAAVKQAINVLKMAKATEQKERAVKIEAIVKKLKSGSGSVVSMAVRLLFLAIAATTAAIGAAFAMLAVTGGKGVAGKIAGDVASKSVDLAGKAAVGTMNAAQKIGYKADTAVTAAKGALTTAGKTASGAVASVKGLTTASAIAASKGFSTSITTWIVTKGGGVASAGLYAKIVTFMMVNPLVALGIYAAILGLLIVGAVKIYKAAKAHGVPAKIAAAAVSLQQSVRTKFSKMVA